MTLPHETPAVLRVTWLLFSDLSTRLNILSDECAHLQDTIFGLLPSTSNETLGTEKPANRVSGQTERPWVSLNPRCSKYHALPNHERALINLWNGVGSLAKALDAHRLEVSECFHAAVRSILDKTSESAEFYWFTAQRGHFLHDVFDFHTQQLQHAHQKLVQLLENMPGSLPSPLLLRRWHSAFYGEFLSEYSRHVNWQTQVLTWELLRGSLLDIKQFDDFRKWRDTSFLTHTWDHIPTSRARRHRIDRQRNSLPIQFGTIWSSFFYLEQPILFPLLYHECAHFHLDDPLVKKTQLQEPIINFDSSAKRGGAKFFDARAEAATTLGSLVQLNVEDARFWHQFTEEVWADALAIALGGTGYFAALFLQLFGHCGASAYSRYEAGADELIDIETFGNRRRQVRELPWPLFHTNDHTYFWEARLRIAIEMTRLLHGNSEWLEAIITTVDYYLASYRAVFSADSTSHLHETYANLRIECNEWATNVCLRCLKPHIDSLKAHKDVDDVYRLDNEICDLIARAVNGYQDKVLARIPDLGLPELGALTLPEKARLEDLSFLTRWHLSSFVLHALTGNRSADVRRTFVTTYANYMRNDGGTAFRLGLEWCVMKKEMYDAAADAMAAPRPTRGDPSLGSVLAALQSAANQDRRIIEGAGFTNEAGAEFLRRKQQLTRENYLPRNRTMSFPSINKAIREELTQALDYLGLHTVPSQVRVGTLYLGVLRPWEIAAASSPEKLDETGLYARAIDATRVYFATAHEELVKRVYPAVDYKHDFAPLVGEYSFLAYSLGVTPVERDIHPWNVPKHFTKPRFVVEVFRGGRATLAVSSNVETAVENDFYKGTYCPENSSPCHETVGGEIGRPERFDRKNGLFAQSESGLGRLTLFRFRYRWQWIEVYEFVKTRQHKVHPILWLSSGWEDAILITWHPSENEYWRQHAELLKLLGDDVECQSNAIIPNLLKEATEVSFPSWIEEDAAKNGVRETWVKNILCGERKTTIEPFVELRRRQEGPEKYTIFGRKKDDSATDRHVVERVNRRTGRYDYTIVWKRDRNKSNGDLRDFAEVIQGLPTWFWKHIGRISTSYEERVELSSGLSDGDADSVLVSRILMRSSSRGH